jgi:hypothetical protein
MDDIDIYSSYKATYHGHTNNDRAGQYPNYSDLGTFMTGPRFSDIRYHMTYITTIPQRVFVWDNATGRGYNFSPDVWKGKK